LKKILANPKLAKSLSLDLKWALISLMVETYKADKNIMDKCFEISMEIEPDLGVSMIRIVKNVDKKAWNMNVMKCSHWKKFNEMNGKFIL
jgi:hypothetical protein